MRAASSLSMNCFRRVWLVAIIAFMLASICFASTNASAQELQAYTEDWPPYNYYQEGHVTGILTDILKEACALEKIQCPVQLVPWARAYKTVQENANTLIYGIAKTPTRESQLSWVGPILPRTTWIFIRSGLSAKVKSLKDLDSLKIGMIRGEASVDELLQAGVSKDAITLFNSNNDVMRTFKAGKIDVLVNTEIGMEVNQKNFQIGDDQIKRAMKFFDGGSIYFGVNLRTDPSLLERLQSSIDKMRREGRIQAIVLQYTKKL